MQIWFSDILNDAHQTKVSTSRQTEKTYLRYTGRGGSVKIVFIFLLNCFVIMLLTGRLITDLLKW